MGDYSWADLMQYALSTEYFDEDSQADIAVLVARKMDADNRTAQAAPAPAPAAAPAPAQSDDDSTTTN
jgi:hypothetical protein